jgi:hypothetical protein
LPQYGLFGGQGLPTEKSSCVMSMFVILLLSNK